MTAIFDTLGRPLRPVLMFVSGYGGIAIVAAAIETWQQVPREPLHWLFAGTAGPALALALSIRASTTDRLALGTVGLMTYATAVTLVAIPTVRNQLAQDAHNKLAAIAELDLVFLSAFVVGAT